MDLIIRTKDCLLFNLHKIINSMPKRIRSPDQIHKNERKRQKEKSSDESKDTDSKLINMADARKKAEKAKKEKEQKEEFKYSDSDSEFEYCPSPNKRKTSAISEATSKWIIEGVEHELIYSDSEASSDEEIVETMVTIFDYFDEHIIQGDDNWLFRALSFATFGDDEYHFTIRETI